MHFFTRFLFLMLFLVYSPAQAAQAEQTAPATQAAQGKKPTICLNMIVKDEKDVITRCLSSVLPIIDYWVIVDTGSSDGTQEIIKNFMKEKNVAGELHERPWKNFGHNRNEALQLAKEKGDYVFFIDADEYLSYEPGFKIPTLDKDFFYVTMSFGGTHYGRTALVKNQLNWKWEGVLHEAVTSSEAHTSGLIEKAYNVVVTDGARSKDPLKYEKDAATLEAGLLEEPNNTRYVFYLAQSYMDCGKNELALQNYEKRVKMGGWDQEVYYSLLKIANIQERMEMPHEALVKSYKRAFDYRKSRAEPLYFLANLYRAKGDFKTGYKIAKIGASIPPSKDVLFVQDWIYDYGLPLEVSVNAYWTGRYKECKKISQQLLKKDLSEDVRSCVQANLNFAEEKLREKNLEAALKEVLNESAEDEMNEAEKDEPKAA